MSQRSQQRSDYRHFQVIPTRWMDNDIYGHVNNVHYYSYFDTAVNQFLIERGVLDIHDLPNVYVDTSGSQPDAGFVEFAVEQLGAERILYGSDAPIRDYASQLAKVTGARISDRERQRILGENAARLLNL